MKGKILQQGQADGLCGLYAVMNFLQQTEWAEREATDALCYLLDACRHFGWLSPEHITQGFADYQLKAIVDLQIENWRLPYTTAFLEDAKRSSREKSVFRFLQKVLQAKGSAIVSLTRRSHWLLVTDYEGKPQVWDSAAREPAGRPLSEFQRSFSPTWGLIILPRNRAQRKPVFDAQTN